MKVDVLVVGAGILGLSTAYHVKRLNPGKDVLLIDKYSAAGYGNSAKSFSAFRNLFSSVTNFLLADSSIDFFFHVQSELGYDLGIRRIGYMFLFSEGEYKRRVSTLRKVESLGGEFRYYEREDLKRMIPGAVLELEGDEEAELMGLESVSVGVFGVKCGYLAADSLLRFYEEEFRKLGGRVRYGLKATELILEPVVKLGIDGEPFAWQNARVFGVRTAEGEIRADTVILATGPWVNELLDPVGIDSHVKPKKRQVFVLKGPGFEPFFGVKGFNEDGVMPLTILPNVGIYFRPDLTERSVWVGCADDLGRKFELEEDPKPERNYYLMSIYWVLRKYFPHFEGVEPHNAWAGLYSINTIDALPCIFEEAGVIVVNGESGSGLMKADAIGRIAASLYAGEEYAELFGGRRFRVQDLSIRDRRVEKEELVI